ncbi:unnamed protein product, partial [Gadus morhua 'NCC']
AVLLVSVQGIAANVDPVVCTWLLHQPHRTGSRQQQQQQAPAVVAMAMPLAKRREDEVSVGSTPLAKQPSNQASDYASSPVKTKTVTESRPLSIPMKVMPISTAVESWSTSEERMKALIAHAWDAVKRLTLQLEVQSCCVFLPNDSLPSPSTIICGDIPGTVRSWYHNQASMPGTLVVCLPQISVLSAGHKYMEPLQELPFVVSKPILEEGDAFPWTISLSQFSVYTLLGQQHSLSLLEPMGCTSTLAVTSHRPQASEGRQSFVVCLHVDLQPVQVKCSNPQVQLLYELFLSWSTTWARLQKHSVLRQTSGAPETPQGAALTSPVRSSAGTVLPDASTCSPSADLGSPTEGDSVPAGDDGPFSDTVTLEQKTSSIGGTSGKVSLWMQWMLPKVTVKLYAPDSAAKNTEICVIAEMEDLSASVDVQDVYTKIKCKVVSFNMDHYRCSPAEGVRSVGGCGGVILSCTDKLNRRTVLVRPVSKQDSFSHFSGFFPPTAARVLEGSHQQHGFLSITYTQAVTKNVRHKLTTRPERPERPPRGCSMAGGQRGAADPLADGSPQYLREILLTAQPFDVVLSCPLMAAVMGLFQATVPRRYRERGKSSGQPMRSHALTSRCLPLIYINTSTIRVFCPGTQDKHTATESHQSKEDTLVLKLGSVSMAPQADNPLSRTVLRKDIYHWVKCQRDRDCMQHRGVQGVQGGPWGGGPPPRPPAALTDAPVFGVLCAVAEHLAALCVHTRHCWLSALALHRINTAPPGRARLVTNQMLARCSVPSHATLRDRCGTAVGPLRDRCGLEELEELEELVSIMQRLAGSEGRAAGRLEVMMLLEASEHSRHHRSPRQPQASVPPQSLQQRVSGGVPCRAVACRGGTQGGQTFYHSFPELCPCGRASGCLSGPGRALTEESGITPQLSRLKQRP